MSTIKLRNRLAGAAIAPLPGTPATAGEPYFNVPGWTGNGPNSLWIDDGAALVPLVDNTRQVELAGDQSIAGVKTIAGTLALPAAANMTFGDGTPGDILTKGPLNSITWGPAPISSVLTDGVTISGNGVLGTEIALIPAIFDVGLVWDGPTSRVRVAQATQAVFGGGLIATAPNVAAGALDTVLLTPLGLRSQMGADAATLVTNVKTVVPAINEIFDAITQLVGVVIFAGTYDATLSEGTFNGQGGIAAATGPLPAASTANHGAYVIVTIDGPGGVPPEPAGAIGVGDWLLSDGTAWIKMPFSQAPITAANVGVVPAVAGGNNVQDALEGLETLAMTPGFYDPASFTGDALTLGTQLVLAVVDGGTF